MSKSIQFSEYEAAILLDAFLKAFSGEISRRDAIRECSEDLRKMALSQGLSIDDVYRNVAGITFQMYSMESAYQGKTVLKPATKLFKRIVYMYKNDTKEYERILKKAQLMIECRLNHEAEFIAWLSKRVSSTKLSSFSAASKEVEKYAIKRGAINQSIYEKIDANIFEEIKELLITNKMFVLLHKRQMGIITSLLDYLIAYALEIDKNHAADSATDASIIVDLFTEGNAVGDDKYSLAEKEEDVVERINYSLNELDTERLIKQEETTSRHFIREDKEQFFKWLRDNKCFREEDAVRIVRRLKQAEDYAKEYINSGCRLLSGSTSEIVKTIEELSRDEEFVRRNYSKNNKSFKALRLFVEFVEEDLGRLKFHKNNIIYKQSGKNIVRTETPLRSWTVYKHPKKEDSRNEQKAHSLGQSNIDALRVGDANEQSTISVQNDTFENTEKDFSRWLNTVEGLDTSICKKYVEGVLVAERYALLNNFTNYRFFGSINSNSGLIVRKVLQDSTFAKTYKNHLKALRKYDSFLGYITSNIEEKETANYHVVETHAGEVIAETERDLVDTVTEEAYRNWLLQNDFTDARSKRTIEAIYLAERYASLNEYSPYKLFGTDRLSATQVARNLLDDDQFCRTYEKYRYSLRLYLYYLGKADNDHNLELSKDKVTADERLPKSKGIQNSDSEKPKDDDAYRFKYPELYSKLSMIADAYYRPNGMTLSEICRFIGTGKKKAVSEILDHVSWARLSENGNRYILQSISRKSTTKDRSHKHGELLPESRKTSNSIPVTNKSNVATEETINYDKEKFKEILMRRFKNGMLFDSIDLDVFRDTYNTVFDEELVFDDVSLTKRLKMCGVVYKDRLFPAEGIIDNVVKEQLFAYIDNSFSSGKTVLYYKAIFEDLSDAFANCYALVDEDMLHAYLEYASMPGKYFFSEKFLSKEENVTANPTKEVEEYLLASGRPMKVEELFSTLSHIPNDQIMGIIRSESTILRNANGEYYTIGIFEASEKDLQTVSAIISDYIEEDEYAIWNDVWNTIQDKMPIFIENNPYLSSLGVRNAIAYHCSKEFRFEASVISLPGNNYRMWDIYHLYAKHHQTFSLDDINRLSKDLNCRIYFDAIAEASVRVSYEEFISKELIFFDIDVIDGAISSFMSKDYIRIREVDSFLTFPYVGYEWNEYLLESYLLSYSKKLKLLNNGLSLNNVAGVIAKREGKIKSFVDACADVIAEGNVELKKDSALTYLVETNMITRRSYKDINEALVKASQIRLRGRR